LLVRPEFSGDTFYDMQDVCEMLGKKSASPPTGLLTVAALLPDSWQLRCIDEDVEPVTDEDIAWSDLVLISGIASQQFAMQKIVERAHAVGKLTVVGGSGVTLEPNLVPEADFVVIGEAEDTLPQLLADLGAGRSSGQYISKHKADMKVAVTPRYDLAKLDRYIMIGVAFARGCPFACEFCAQIEIFGQRTRTKTVQQVIKELQMIYDLGYRGQIDFGFDNLIGDVPAAEQVLAAMAEWGKKHGYPFHYSTEATMNVARMPRVLKLMQDNEFRMVFIGIESGDEDVLERTQKGQNVGTKPSEAVSAVNRHGMLVNTGLILGFDGETKDSADNILKMLARTGAFPTLILPLHALPSTALERRMRDEGRLFADGRVAMNTTKRTDTATTGLNFVTERSRADILRDLVWVLEQAYEPKNAYARIEKTLSQLKIKPKYKPDLKEITTYAKAFATKIVPGLGWRKETRKLFWKTFVKTLATGPLKLPALVTMAVMHDNYLRQTESYIQALEQQIAYVEKMGEKAFNEAMVAEDAVREHVDYPSANANQATAAV
jgi:radical SAM superfamily enzyme YgiQ (UPF0313 family)